MPPQLRLLRASLGALQTVAPPLAAAWGEVLFRTPRRHRTPAREREWLAQAQPFVIADVSSLLSPVDVIDLNAPPVRPPQTLKGLKVVLKPRELSVMLKSGLDISPVITHRFDYRDYEAAFAAARTGSSGKVVMDWTS